MLLQWLSLQWQLLTSPTCLHMLPASSNHNPHHGLHLGIAQPEHDCWGRRQHVGSCRQRWQHRYKRKVLGSGTGSQYAHAYPSCSTSLRACAPGGPPGRTWPGSGRATPGCAVLGIVCDAVNGLLRVECPLPMLRSGGGHVIVVPRRHVRMQHACSVVATIGTDTNLLFGTGAC